MIKHCRRRWNVLVNQYRYPFKQWPLTAVAEEENAALKRDAHQDTASMALAIAALLDPLKHDFESSRPVARQTAIITVE